MRIKCHDCKAIAINGHPSHETGCLGVFEFTERGKTYAQYKVWSLDVWGNAREGFEVNDRCYRETITVRIDTKDDDKTLIKALKKLGLLKSKVHFKSIRIDDDGDGRFLMVDAAKTSEPIYQLERI